MDQSISKSKYLCIGNSTEMHARRLFAPCARERERESVCVCVCVCVCILPV